MELPTRLRGNDGGGQGIMLLVGRDRGLETIGLLHLATESNLPDRVLRESDRRAMQHCLEVPLLNHLKYLLSMCAHCVNSNST